MSDTPLALMATSVLAGDVCGFMGERGDEDGFTEDGAGNGGFATAENRKVGANRR